MTNEQIKQIALDFQWGRIEMDFDLFLAIKEETDKGESYEHDSPFWVLVDEADQFAPKLESALLKFYRPKSQGKPNPIGDAIGKETLTEYFRNNHPEHIARFQSRGWID